MSTTVGTASLTRYGSPNPVWLQIGPRTLVGIREKRQHSYLQEAMKMLEERKERKDHRLRMTDSLKKKRETDANLMSSREEASTHNTQGPKRARGQESPSNAQTAAKYTNRSRIKKFQPRQDRPRNDTCSEVKQYRLDPPQTCNSSGTRLQNHSSLPRETGRHKDKTRSLGRNRSPDRA